MGIYDREYYRHATRGPAWRAIFTSSTKTLIAINAAVFLAVLVTKGDDGPVFDALILDGRVAHGQIWRLLTTAFLHANLLHLAFNMIFLWIVGGEMEGLYGRRDFTAMYLTAAVVGNLAWLIFRVTIYGEIGMVNVLGASGAVWGVVVLYTMYYPSREILILGILPAPIWLVATFYLGLDLMSLYGQFQKEPTAPVAFAAHLGGAAYGALFKIYDLRWSRLISLMPTGRPKLRIVRPEPVDVDRDFSRTPGGSRSISASAPSRPSPTVQQGSSEEHLEARVDEILAKIASQGRSSLSDEENRILQEASRRARAKRSEKY